jgi:AcrR family transcriptional regulator
VSSALELFALQPWELVTVSEIVARAGMTPAAFYYHFNSRDELLEELVRDFSDRWGGQGERLWDAAPDAESFAAVVPQLLDWIADQVQAATVFFLSAVGSSFAIDTLRTHARDRLIRSADKALQRVDPTLSRSESAVRATAAVVLCEVTSRSLLSRDDAYRTLGPRRFQEETRCLVETVVGR